MNVEKMLGLKTKIVKTSRNILNKISKGKITNDFQIKFFMDTFKVDEYGHRASIKNADLGYGWIHYSLIRTIKPKNILCIGSRYGYIPAILAQACKDNGFGHVDFVDAGYDESDKNNWTGVGYWKTKDGKDCFKKFNLSKQISLYIKTTQKFSGNNTYEYVYIDGNHSYDGVKHDYKKYWPKVKKGGFIVFHDINVTENKIEGEYGVKRLWKEISNKNSIEFSFIGSGLGIKQKKNNASTH